MARFAMRGVRFASLRELLGFVGLVAQSASRPFQPLRLRTQDRGVLGKVGSKKVERKVVRGPSDAPAWLACGAASLRLRLGLARAIVG